MPSETSTRQGAALDPVTHYTLIPIFFANLIVSVAVAIQAQRHHALHWWWVVVSVGLIVINIKQRVYTLRIQDRVIRLEEQLRYVALLTPQVLATSRALTLPQTIALRFASDAELPDLVRRAVAESLTQKQIKQAIETWKPDLVRV